MIYYIEDTEKVIIKDDNKNTLIATLEFMPTYKNYEIKEATSDADFILINNIYYLKNKLPETALDDLKEQKQQQLSSVSGKYQLWNCTDVYITSSLGFKVNADQCSQNNISVLVGLLNDTAITSFKLYDNTFKDLTKSELNTLLLECRENGLALYQQKFTLQAKISSCTTVDELNDIEIVFTMKDFTK